MKKEASAGLVIIVCLSSLVAGGVTKQIAKEVFPKPTVMEHTAVDWSENEQVWNGEWEDGIVEEVEEIDEPWIEPWGGGRPALWQEELPTVDSPWNSPVGHLYMQKTKTALVYETEDPTAFDSEFEEVFDETTVREVLYEFPIGTHIPAYDFHYREHVRIGPRHWIKRTLNEEFIENKGREPHHNWYWLDEYKNLDSLESVAGYVTIDEPYVNVWKEGGTIVAVIRGNGETFPFYSRSSDGQSLRVGPHAWIDWDEERMMITNER